MPITSDLEIASCLLGGLEGTIPGSVLLVPSGDPGNQRAYLIAGSLAGYIIEATYEGAFDTFGFRWQSDARFIPFIAERVLPQMEKKNRIKAKRLVWVMSDLAAHWRELKFVDAKKYASLGVVRNLLELYRNENVLAGTWDMNDVLARWSSELQASSDSKT